MIQRVDKKLSPCCLTKKQARLHIRSPHPTYKPARGRFGKSYIRQSNFITALYQSVKFHQRTRYENPTTIAGKNGVHKNDNNNPLNAKVAYLSHIRQTPRMKPARAQLHDLFPAEPLQQFGSVLVPFGVAVSGNAVLLVAPAASKECINRGQKETRTRAVAESPKRGVAGSCKARPKKVWSKSRLR